MINYYLITKPGILAGNLLTLAAGFCLASKNGFNVWLFLAAFLGLAFIMASACVFNNYIDRHMDQKMQRTKDRALVTGAISPFKALTYATLLGILGNVTLYAYTNLLALFLANFGFFVYVVLYSMWKSRTVYGTALGSIAGAVPPVVGYCAVSNQFDLGALLLFLMLVLWQMPHFFAIALYHYDDYRAAQIPLLPIVKGIWQTKVHMLLYILAFIGVASLLTYFNYLGYIYLSVLLSLGLTWLALGLAGFTTNNNIQWGKQMFGLSLVLITAICLVIPFDRI